MTKPIMERERESKRIKFMDTITINAHCTPVQRRLRKMKDHFQPVSFRFQVQACWLCVGMSVVYRVSLALTILNPCSSRADGGHTTQSTCVVAMSQTKFCRFFAQVSTILHDPAVVQRLTTLMPIQHQGAVADSKTFEEFIQVLTKVFQRYEHFQYTAFTTQADANTMNGSKVQLEEFLSDCWQALQNILPALAVEPHLPASLGSESLSIYLLMRNFLSLPDFVLDANRTYADAVLSLDNVELMPIHFEHSCSICLEPLVRREMVELLAKDNGKCSYLDSRNSYHSEGNSTAQDARNLFSVKLPCAHIYHENCIMSWMRHNPSCPECRALVGAGQQCS